MKKYLFTAILAVGALTASADYSLVPANTVVSQTQMNHNGSYLDVAMNMNLADMNVKSNQAVVLYPYLVNGTDTLGLPPVGVYGKRRFIHYRRANGDKMIAGPAETSIKASDATNNYQYQAQVDYQPWMNGAELMLDRKVYGCCSNVLADSWDDMGKFFEVKPFRPTFAFIQPVATGVKDRAVEGTAFVDFVVDKYDIRPNYRNNAKELAKIRATIDSVRDDKDITITGIWLKGYASPEGSYTHNGELAKNRTESLKKYVNSLYHFNNSQFTTAFEPEDWTGLRTLVANSDIKNKSGILKLIDSQMEPDAKEAKIKSTYPQEYAFMLREWYPGLRRTDYRVDYVVRDFTDINEIKSMIQTAPNKVSPNEFYLAAQTYKPGSEEFDALFETVARVYPNDQLAQVNAANAAMQRGDLVGAAEYLTKAGNSKEANYTRGLLAGMQGDYDKAYQLIQAAQQAGVPEAAASLKALNEAFGK